MPLLLIAASCSGNRTAESSGQLQPGPTTTRSAETTTSRAAAPGSVLWRRPLNDLALAPPVVSNGVAYIGTNTGAVYAVDARTGDIRWRTRVDGPIRAAATTGADLVFVGSSNGTLHALESTTGAERWKYSAHGLIEVAPVFNENTVFVTSDEPVHENSGYIAAVDATTGSQRWVSQPFALITAPPAVTGGQLVFGAHDAFVHSISSADGTPRWSFRTENKIDTSPTIAAGDVVIGSGDASLYALNADSGHLVGSVQAPFGFDASPVAKADIVYFVAVDGANEGSVHALDVTAGNELWKTTIPRGTPGADPALSSNGILYVGTGDGAVVAVTAHDGKQRWAYSDAGAPVLTPAATADGVLAVTNGGVLFALAP